MERPCGQARTRAPPRPGCGHPWQRCATRSRWSKARVRRFLMVIAADYPLMDIIWTMFVFFAWVMWFWLLITVFSDLFRRHDTSGWGKAGWTVLLLVLPFVGVLIYMVAQGKHMAERNTAQAEANRAQFDNYVRDVA